MLYALALLAGIVAGSRVFTAVAAVSWAAKLGALNLDGSWLALMGYAWTPWIFTLLAIVELVTDQLPSTPSRRSPSGLAPVLSAAPYGRDIGAAAASWIIGLIAGVIGAVIGTFGGAEIRSYVAKAFGRDTPAGSVETRRHHPWAHHHLGAPMNRHFDAIVIGVGRAGPSMVGRLAAAGRRRLIERDLIGGTCVNTGCTPTKTLVASAYAAHLARRAIDFGVRSGRSALIAPPSWRAKTPWSAIPAHISRIGCKDGKLHSRPRPRPIPLAHDNPGRRRRARGGALLHQRRMSGQYFPTFLVATR